MCLSPWTYVPHVNVRTVHPLMFSNWSLHHCHNLVTILSLLIKQKKHVYSSIKIPFILCTSSFCFVSKPHSHCFHFQMEQKQVHYLPNGSRHLFTSQPLILWWQNQCQYLDSVACHLPVPYLLWVKTLWTNYGPGKHYFLIDYTPPVPEQMVQPSEC